MPANVETMFYVGQVPWHGLGRQLPDVVSWQEAIKAAGLDWRVGHADPATFTRIYTQTVARAQEHAARVGNELVTNSGRFAEPVEHANP